MSFIEDKIKAAQAVRRTQQVHQSREQSEHDAEMDRLKQQRTQFLETTHAVSIPMPLYALWLATYLQQGGEISHSYGRPFETPGRVANGGYGPGVDALRYDPVPESPGYNYAGFHNWMPTNRRSTEVARRHDRSPSLRSGIRIPEGYGAFSMTLLVITDLVDIDLTPATRDWRDGWEWGHTTVLTLGKDGNRLVAWTNNKYSVNSYSDVEAFILQNPLKAMTEKYFQAIHDVDGETKSALRP